MTQQIFFSLRLNDRREHILTAPEILLADILKTDQVDVEPLLLRRHEDMGEQTPETELIPLAEAVNIPLLGEEMNPALHDHEAPGTNTGGSPL